MTSCVDFLNNYADYLSNNPSSVNPRPHPILFTGVNCTGSFWPSLDQEPPYDTIIPNPYGISFRSLYIPPGWSVDLVRPDNSSQTLPGPDAGQNTPTLYVDTVSLNANNSLSSMKCRSPFSVNEFIRRACADNRITVLGLRTLFSHRPGTPECDSFMTSFCFDNPSDPACVCLAEEVELQQTFCTPGSTLSACSNTNQLAAFLPVTCFGQKCSSGGYRFERMRDQRCNITLCKQTLTALGESVVIDGSSTLWCGNRPYVVKENEDPNIVPSVSAPMSNESFSLPSWAYIVIGFAIFILCIVLPLFIIMIRRAYAKNNIMPAGSDTGPINDGAFVSP